MKNEASIPLLSPSLSPSLRVDDSGGVVCQLSTAWIVVLTFKDTRACLIRRGTFAGHWHQIDARRQRSEGAGRLQEHLIK